VIDLPDNPNISNGELYGTNGDLKGQRFQEALERVEDDDNIMAELGRAYLDANEYEALKWLEGKGYIPSL